MERKLVRFTAMVICIFSAFTCITIWFLPALEQRLEAFSASILREQAEREERYALLEKMSGLEIMDYNTRQAVKEAKGQKAAENAGGQDAEGNDSTNGPQENLAELNGYLKERMIRLELPEQTNGAGITIVPDYARQQIQIQIPGADKHYLYDYQLIGKNDEIAGLDYVYKSGSGTIIFTMDKVMEVESNYDQQYLYLDFKYPKDIYEKVVVIDAGHGGRAPGAVYGDIYEKNITLAIVRQIKEMFDKDGNSKIGVYYTRLDDTDQDLDNRVGLANNSDADLFVSVHINSSKEDYGEGIEVMYDEDAADTAFDSKDFAQICLEEEVAAMGAKNRGLISGNKIYVIRSAKMPAALVEAGFINNPDEVTRLLDASYQRQAAYGIYNAILKSLYKLDKVKGK